MSNVLPEKVAEISAYVGKKPIGFVDCELPSLTFLTDTLSGAGIAGELNTALIGQTESMETTLNFRLPMKEVIQLLNPNGTNITLRAGMQTIDRATKQTLPMGWRCSMFVKPTGLELGSLTKGEGTESSLTLEVWSIAIYVADELILDHDKINNKFQIGDTDYLEPYRNLV